MKRLVLAILCVASFAHAGPALETYAGQGYSLQVPKGWKVTADAARGQLVAQQDPSRADAAQLHSRATQIESGTYAFDGKRLVMTVKAAAGDYSNCGAKPVHEAVKQLPKPRSYDVGVAPDGWLVLVGPACGAFPELSCPERAGWEMPAQK